MNNEKRLTYLPLEYWKYLPLTHAAVIHYLLYRSNLPDWKFHANDIGANLNLTRKCVAETLKRLPFISKVGNRRNSHYDFSYAECVKYIVTLSDNHCNRRLHTVINKENNKENNIIVNNTIISTLSAKQHIDTYSYTPDTSTPSRKISIVTTQSIEQKLKELTEWVPTLDVPMVSV